MISVLPAKYGQTAHKPRHISELFASWIKLNEIWKTVNPDLSSLTSAGMLLIRSSVSLINHINQPVYELPGAFKA